MQDDFGDRMKSYEKVFTENRLDSSLPVYARLDGRSFSKFTRKMERPYDARMSKTMIETAEFLVKETKATVGYVQSDEISLLWRPSDGDASQFMFDGKIQKLASVLASMCSAKFVLQYLYNFEEEPLTTPSFDCRILNVPSMIEADNMVYWRMQDAFKNAVQSAAHDRFGHSKLMGVKTRDKIKMLAEDGVDFFKDYPEYFRRGTYITPRTEERWLTETELEKIPVDHRPTTPVFRTSLVRMHPMNAEIRFNVESRDCQPLDM